MSVIAFSFTWFLVRKHPAPEGALRPLRDLFALLVEVRQKAPSTRRCIKTLPFRRVHHWTWCQKAPSTRRCIKTNRSVRTGLMSSSQKAPSTRRCIKTLPFRRVHHWTWCQKAPSTRRCIKTNRSVRTGLMSSSQKAPSTRRCIKTGTIVCGCFGENKSESTQHQKVH